AEIDAALGKDAPLFRSIYDVSEHGNWEGSNILNRRVGDADAVTPRSDVLQRCRDTLLAIRAGRIPPQRDDKILADWNGLAIAALARAGTLLDVPEWIAHAQTIFGFIVDNLVKDGRLLHTWCAGQARHPAVIDDYANMARAALALHQTTGDPDYLAHAVHWVEVANTQYWDQASGGYFLAANDTRDLIVRTKTVFDNATPSGNGIMLEVLAQLYLITGDTDYRDRADDLITALAPKDPRALLNQPSIATGYETLSAAHQVVIATKSRTDEQAQALFNAAVHTAPPGTIISWAFPHTEMPTHHPAAGKTAIDGMATAYVCRGPVCGLPIQTPTEITAAFG
nr:thioredoxin domain-containing protein [Alphaproteobacteria bacterium]